MIKLDELDAKAYKAARAFYAESDPDPGCGDAFIEGYMQGSIAQNSGISLQIAKYKQQIDILKDALNFYGDDYNWTEFATSEDLNAPNSPAYFDQGQVARDALEEIKKL